MAKQHPYQKPRNPQFSMNQRAAIVKYHAANSTMQYEKIAEWAQKEFKLTSRPNPTTIGRIITNKDAYAELAPQDRHIKRVRVIAHPQLDTALANWVLQMQYQKLRIDTAIIQAKAVQFGRTLDIPDGTLQFSNGWLQKFCKRHRFQEFRIHGESGDAQMQNIEEELQHIKHIIAQYTPDDIYNMDETGLFYNLAPDKTIAQRQIEGAKKDKTRITIGFTCNASGSDRLSPLFIGHAAKPRCFKKKSGEELGFFYLHNKTAWMTGIFFEIFLRRLNIHVNRKVLLIIDNAPSHIWNESEFPNLQILSLPPNTISKLQSLDVEIITSFKRHYRRYQFKHAINLLEIGSNSYKVDQLIVMR